MQECKSPVEKIPLDVFSKIGFPHLVARGQKGYNGVAIISRLPIKEHSAIDFADLGHARHIAASLENGIVIHNFYIPAGGDVPDRSNNEKFDHKLKFLDEMANFFKFNKNQKVMRTYNQPLSPDGGVVGLKGNLAPDGAIVKIAGLKKLQFTGRARCFRQQEQFTVKAKVKKLL